MTAKIVREQKHKTEKAREETAQWVTDQELGAADAAADLAKEGFFGSRNGSVVNSKGLTNKP